MKTNAIIFEAPQKLSVSRLALVQPVDADVVVDIAWSGISTGTERLLWTGRMPNFPGMGYPLVPGYESVGRVSYSGATSGVETGALVFVPGARCFGDVRGLFGGAASRLVVQGSKVTPISETLGEKGVLLALAATAYHACIAPDGSTPDLIVGHGVLARLIARIALAVGGAAPTVWETNPRRMDGGRDYAVIDSEHDVRRDYRCIVDASGAVGLLDTLIGRLSRGGEVVLAGFYEAPLTFAFPPAFMREARIRIAAEWRPEDMVKVTALVNSGKLSLDGLITHRHSPDDAHEAYATAFDDADCLKMVLNWSEFQ